MLRAHERLGDFEIIRFLGRGGMSEVYEALQHNPERPVALKVLTPSLAGQRGSVERFEREAAALAQLDHPGIIRILTTGRTADGTFYYTMQLIRGVSLHRLIRAAAAEPERPGAVTVLPADTAPGSTRAYVPSTKPADAVPPQQLRRYRDDRFGLVRDVGIQGAKALFAAHRREILHRDVKSSNFMIDGDGHVYLLDFGLVRLLDSEETRPGVKGTPWYMSPEQASGDPLDARSDIYSLGVTLYELSTAGVGPFEVDRSDHEAVVAAVRAGQVLPLPTLCPAVPAGLRRVIERAMAFARDDRYANAGEMVAELEGQAATRPARADSRTPLLITPTPRRRLVLTAAALAVPAVAFGTWYAVRTFGPATPTTRPKTLEAVFAPFGPDCPLPRELRDREVGQQISLVRTGFAPVWSAPVFGEGEYLLDPESFVLNPKKRGLYLLALDYDPRARWFEFNVEMRPSHPVRGAAAHRQGLFFGYRRNVEDPDRRYPFFVVEVKENRTNDLIDGNVVVGWAYLEEKKGQKGQVMQWYAPFPDARATIRLKPRRLGEWRRLRIKAVDRVVSVGVDNESPRGFNVSTLRVDPVGWAGGDLDPRGALGVWASDGVGTFGQCWVAALPSEAVGREAPKE